MKKILSTLLLLALPALALASDLDYAYRLPAELQTPGPQALDELTWQQGSTPLIQVEVLRRGKPVTADTNTTVRMIIGQSATSTYYVVTEQGVTTGTSYYVQWPTIGTNSLGTNSTPQAWWYTIYFERNGHRYWTGNGDLYIEKTTSTDADGLTWQTLTVNSVAWSNVTGSVLDNPSLLAEFATKADTNDLTAHTTNKLNPHTVTAAQVGAVATNAAGYLNLLTNTATAAQGALADSALQSEADTNALAQLVIHTNKSAQAAHSGLGTAAASNASDFATAAQGAKADTALQSEADTNALAQLTSHAGLTGTNAHGLGSASLSAASAFATSAQGALAETALQVEADTNALAQLNAQIVLQASTNAGFQALHNAQASTNANLQAQITAVNTGQVTAATYNAHLVTQGSTNAALQSQITVNTTGKVTLVTYNAGISAQANTNAVFRNLFTAQVNTNSGYESRIAAREAYDTAQTATNTVFRNLFTAQANTNAGFETRIQKGELAESWGDHALAGYLTAGTNLFKEIYVADRSKLSTNTSGLTQGTYTGVVEVAGVSYTGVTVMVVGRTYELGFTKQNAYGTATLSIGAFSKSATAAGVASNYFSYTGTDTNLILHIIGTGSSKSDVSAVYVKQITNGSAHVSGDLDVGGVFRWNGNLVGTAATNNSSDFDAAGLAAAVQSNLGAASNALHTAIINNLYLQSLSNAYFESAKTDLQAQVDSATNRIAQAEGYTNEAHTAYLWGDWSIYGFLTNEARWIAESNLYVAKSDTNGWEIGSHSAFVDASVTNDLNARIESLTNGAALGELALQPAVTNGWEIGAHLAWLTEETLWNAQSNNLVYKSMTNGWEIGSHASLLTTNGNAIGLTNFSASVVLTNNAKLLAALTNETYLGTITGLTVTESSSASSATTNAGVIALNIRTNAAGGGTGSGTITNMAPDAVTSIVWTASGGPEPIGSVTAYVAGVVGPLNSATSALNTHVVSLIGWTNSVIGATNYLSTRNTALTAGTNALQVQATALGAATSSLNQTTFTVAEKSFATSSMAWGPGTNISFTTDAGGMNRINMDSSAFNAATGSLNTVVGALGSATGSLNIAVGNAITNPVGANVNGNNFSITNVNYLQTVGSPGFFVNMPDPTVQYTNNTFVKVNFTNEVFDTTSAYDAATNYRFTPGIAGRYLLACHVDLAASIDAGLCFVSIYKNGARLADDARYKTSAYACDMSVFAVDEAIATDYYEVWIRVPANTTNTLNGYYSLGYFSGARLP